MTGNQHGGHVVKGGETTPHKPAGAQGCLSSLTGLCGTKEQHPYSSEHRQYDGEGGTHSQRLSDLALQVWEWALSRKITLQAEHIPGRENEGADRESRRGEDPSDWTLHPDVSQGINHRWGPLDINPFAARHMPMAEAVDALSQEWTNLSLYAFPPFILLGRVLRKIRMDKVHQAVLLAPIWPNQHWYPLLLEMITDFPVTLPQLPDLLESPAGDPHPLIEEGHLRLAAWKVSGRVSVIGGFRKQLSNLSPLHGDPAQKGCTTVPGGNGVAGVRDGRLVCFRPL